MNGRRRNTFPIDKKTRGLIKKKNTLSQKVASSSYHAIRQEYNRVRNKAKGAVNKIKKKFEKRPIRECQEKSKSYLELYKIKVQNEGGNRRLAY
jgi:hypothetical protein